MFRNQWLWFRQLLINIFLFLQKITNISSIHGFVYVMNYSLHFLERWLWYVCIISALVACSSLARSTWTRFQTSPTVITMDRNKFFWNTSFPTLTICPHKRIDELKVGNYYRTVLAKEPTNMTLEANFINFIVKLSNVSFASIGEMPLDETYGLPSVDYLELIHNFTWPFQPEVTSGIGVKMHLNAVVTELGICYTFNSMVSVYNSFAYWKRNRWNRLAKHEQNVTLTAHPLDGEIYAQILNMSCSYDVYFHGPSEAMEMSQQVYSFGATNYATVNLLALEIRTSADAKKLTTSQRQCRFANEAETLASSPVYSYNLCQMECRKHMIEFLCGCVPHFYRPTGKHKRVYKVCDLDGFRCVLHIKDELIALKSNIFKFECNCMTNCDDSKFYVQSYRSRVWFLGANLQWGYNEYPKMQLKRSLLFGFTDVLVYIGGMAGFFLGLSLLGLTEFVHYFSYYLYALVLKNSCTK